MQYNTYKTYGEAGPAINLSNLNTYYCCIYTIWWYRSTARINGKINKRSTHRLTIGALGLSAAFVFSEGKQTTWDKNLTGWDSGAQKLQELNLRNWNWPILRGACKTSQGLESYWYCCLYPFSNPGTFPSPTATTCRMPTNSRQWQTHPHRERSAPSHLPVLLGCCTSKRLSGKHALWSSTSVNCFSYMVLELYINAQLAPISTQSATWRQPSVASPPKKVCHCLRTVAGSIIRRPTSAC